VQQGWSKNEIIYETQRIFGNDVLIVPGVLEDERSFLGRVLPIIVPAILIGGLLWQRRGNQYQAILRKQADLDSLKQKLRK